MVQASIRDFNQENFLYSSPKPLLPMISFGSWDQTIAQVKYIENQGFNTIECLWRSDNFLETFAKLVDFFPHMRFGVGSLCNKQQMLDAYQAGASFLILPGLTSQLLQTGLDLPVPVLPGAATLSEILLALEWDYSLIKIFPAEALGGIDYIRQMAAPLSQTGVQFCPTGGIGPKNLQPYLDANFVAMIGGSWLSQ
jgi:2-dehydro-3-deoxyphosphogluconate aldolase/(4S)-4-hydroxy-2-oxoglutarate aldolase